MYCSRRGREVSRPTDTCSRCGRCNWEQRDNKHGRKPVWGAVIFLAAAILSAAILFVLR